MKYSKTYLIFPGDHLVQKALQHYDSLYPGQLQQYALPGSGPVHLDNYVFTQGNLELHRYDKKLLAEAVSALQGSLTEAENDQAALNVSLGIFLAAQAEHEKSEALYQQAMDALNTALQSYSEEENPQEWVWAQYALGTASQELARMQDSAKLYKTAVDAYTNASLVWNRNDNPVEWALTMHQLGTSFHGHGMLLKGNRTLQKSVVAYKNALTGLDDEYTGMELMATQNNRGAVLQNLGENEDNPDRIEEAIRAYEAAHSKCMQLQLSIHLAIVCRVNKATAQSVLAQLKQDKAIAEEAAEEFEVIIECFSHAMQPSIKAHCDEWITKTRKLL